MQEPPAELDALANSVIGAALEVHRVLGPGFLESVYEEALVIELGLRSVPFERQKRVAVAYKGHEIGEGRIDLICCRRITRPRTQGRGKDPADTQGASIVILENHEMSSRPPDKLP